MFVLLWDLVTPGERSWPMCMITATCMGLLSPLSELPFQHFIAMWEVGAVNVLVSFMEFAQCLYHHGCRYNYPGSIVEGSHIVQHLPGLPVECQSLFFAGPASTVVFDYQRAKEV